MRQHQYARQLQRHDPVETLIESIAATMANRAMAPIHDRLVSDHRAYVARLDAAIGSNPSVQESSK
jgi:hypothetical protein